MKCYSCGEEIRETSRFCAFCGADQSQRPADKYCCCHCGQEINPGARFCGFCGGNQNEPPVPVEVELEVPAEQMPEIQEEPVPQEAPAEIIPEPAPVEVIPEPEPEPVVVPTPVAEPVPQPVYQSAPQPQYQPYQPQGYWAQPAAQSPVHKLPTKRGMLKMIFLGLITGTLYNQVILSRIAEEINIVASRHDGKRTQQYLWVPLLGALTLFIYVFVWIHGLCNRIGAELQRRNINYKFSAATYWLWGVLGSLIFVGPFIYLHKFMKAMNLINKDYNEKG